MNRFEENTPNFKNKLILLKKKLQLLKKEIENDIEEEDDILNTAFDSSIDTLYVIHSGWKEIFENELS